MQFYIGELSPAESPKGRCLRIDFAGCDYNCGFCNQKYHSQKTEFLKDTREVIKEIELGNEPVYFSGQPCLQKPALIELAGFAKKRKLTTIMDFNGSKPECLQAVLKEKLIDLIKMELPAPLEENEFQRATKSKTFFITTQQLVSNVRKSLEILRRYQDDAEIEFETTIVPGITYRIEDLLKIAKEIRFTKSQWTLKPFRPSEHTLDKNMKGIETPTEKFLHNLRKAILKENHTLRIRIEGY